MRTETTACILCSRNCGLEVELDGERFARIRGDAKHPCSQGYVCQKAARLDYYQNHDDRLTRPLRRRPDGEFEPVSWDAALSDIATRLNAIRDEHGGDAFAFAGGGGQGNHLGAPYSSQLPAAMGSRFVYNSLAQEKTGDFWVNGRLFGRQNCHGTEDVEHADFVLFIGTNPFQAHGIPNARDALKAIRRDPTRTMVVVDPRRTDTAKMADVHLQLRPGTDAYLMSALLAIVVQNDLHDRAFLERRCTGFEQLERVLRDVPVAEYVERAGVDPADVERVARGLAAAESATVRIDLGIQQTLHSTLNSYLEKLLFLITGNFGKRGGNNLHTFLLPIIGHTDERDVIDGKPLRRTTHHGMFPIAGLYPPAILPDEILHGGVRAIFVESCNPAVSWPDSDAYEQAFEKLELLVVVDVALTETARFADYVLPASSQFEKWEATGFNLEFPDNYFHLRHPLFPAKGDTLPEAEIYTRLLEKMGVIPDRFPGLERLARLEPAATRHLVLLAKLARTFAKDRELSKYGASILYRTLGKHLPDGAAAAAPLLVLAMRYAARYPQQVRRAGIDGNRLTLGGNLFRAILDSRSGVTISKHEYDEVWDLVQTADGRIHLAISEMLEELQSLRHTAPPNGEYPFVLLAGERRSYNANQIYRNPEWRKIDPNGAMRMHPEDARELGLTQDDRATCSSATGSVEVSVDLDDGLRRGVVSLPHGYGMRYRGGPPQGPQINRITASASCDPLAKTPYHKHVPVRIERARG
ncbi:MAG: molybdopterin-dependent oxidoreductase [bacterium]|nr:molybdopterin-dependent oxidoreductase [bacterium]